jgi:4-hydroxybenzoate polyprenyltransferase
MLTLINFFKLIRLSNILIMGLTMCAVHLMFNVEILGHCHIMEDQYAYLGLKNDGIEQTYLEILFTLFFNLFKQFDFILLLLSVFFIAAGGNIINDYFDVKADRVNKPDRLIIDKYIKRRWAIILNWTFNGVGFLIAMYLSIKLDNWWIVSIAFLTINLLYFYSAVFKRKFLIGNIVVALLTAIVPIYVYLYLHFSTLPISRSFFYDDDFKFLGILMYAAFAFLFNLIREIIKDMADVKGDLLLKSQTLPIRFGFAKTKIVVSILFVITLIPIWFYYIMYLLFGGLVPDFSASLEIFVLLIFFVGVFHLASFIIMLSKNQRKYYLLSANLIKIAMLMGILSICFYEF